MAIAAQRFNFLDKDTNIAISDFTKVTDNSIYNTIDQLPETALGTNKDLEPALVALQGGLADLRSMVENSFNDVSKPLKDALDSAVDTISNMDLPNAVENIFISLKTLDSNGLKNFLKDMLHIGSTFLCNNLDFLKLFMLGYALNKNILSGLLTALLLSWLDRYCKEFTKEEIAKSNNRDKIDMMFPPKGVNVNSDNAFSLFTNYYSDYLKAKQPYNVPTPLDTNTFINNVVNGDVTNSVLNLKNSEITSADRDIYLNSINTNLNNYPVTSPGYNNLLQAKGQLLNTAFINDNRRNNNIKYEFLSDKLGSYSKNLANVEIKPLNLFNVTDLQNSLFNKLTQLKANASNNSNLLTRNNNTGSYADFNFDSVLPPLSQDEKNYVLNNSSETDSHRLYDLHPTSTVLMEA